MKSTMILLGLATCLVIASRSHAQDRPPKPPELKVLERFVGTWDAEMISKPAAWTPKEVKTTGTNKYEWVLDGRFLQDTEQNGDGSEVFGLWTFDATAKIYRGWFFGSEGNVVEWKGQWDEGLRMEADLGNGVVLTGVNRFPDKDTYEWTLVAKDKDGKVYLDVKDTHRRRDKPLDKPKDKKAGPPRPEELKVLDRLVGSWDTTAISKPAVWTPKEVRTTSKVEWKWVLGGRFLEDATKVSDGTQALSLTTYDPQMKAFRSWWFNSLGHTSKSNGQWDEKTTTLSFESGLPDGLTSRSSVRFIDKDRHEWKVIIKDGDGKVYFDTTWTVTRRKE